jgi:hypothetical protein
MKPLVIYHNPCADGFGAAFAAWLKLGDEAEYLPMQYGYKELPDFNDREVYLLDFSLLDADMDRLFAEAAKVVWCDHHRTSRAYAEKL